VFAAVFDTEKQSHKVIAGQQGRGNIMKAVGQAESTRDSRGAHPPWMGALVPMTPLPESFAGDFWLTAARGSFDLPRPGERVWDAVLALVFVAACAALGWAGAVWL
jgi:hypothetical protein